MFTLPELNYKYDELEPYIDAQTMEIHHSKHHQAYVDKLNGALEGQEVSETDLSAILADLDSLPEDKRMAVRNNGGGHWNHSMFWQVMKPGVSEFAGQISELISAQFGDLDKFKAEFESSAVGRFGSGWVWLTRNGQELKITSTPNQDNPLMDGVKESDILLCLDVWEHAYYLKYQNRRPEYVVNWWNVVDWEIVNSKLSLA